MDPVWLQQTCCLIPVYSLNSIWSLADWSLEPVSFQSGLCTLLTDVDGITVQNHHIDLAQSAYDPLHSEITPLSLTPRKPRRHHPLPQTSPTDVHWVSECSMFCLAISEYSFTSRYTHTHSTTTHTETSLYRSALGGHIVLLAVSREQMITDELRKKGYTTQERERKRGALLSLSHPRSLVPGH